MEVIYRNSVSRTGRFSTVDVNELQFIVGFVLVVLVASSFSSPPRPLHRPLHTTRNTQTGKFRRWKLRVAAAKLPSSARYEEGVNASAPRVTGRPTSGVAPLRACKIALVILARVYLGRTS